MPTAPASTPDTQALEAMRRQLAAWSIRMCARAGSGHPSTCLSASHLLTGLFFGGFLNYDVARPHWPDRDRFVLSKGHGAPILYAALAELGAFPTADLMTLRELGSPLEGHPNARRLPWVEASTGSLGQGLSIGLGMALAARLQGRDFRSWVLMGDGELDEGQVWEAAMAAAKYRTANLTAIVDRNGYQQTGPGDQVLPLEPLADKWAACGWAVLTIDGHDWPAVLEALTLARSAGRDRPLAIIARTVKGFGVQRIVDDPGNKFHGVPLLGDAAEAAVREVLQG
ncbi:MAG: transketolase [Anaerolineae bacterium]